MKQVTPKLDERQKFEITATDGFLRKPTNLRNHRGNLRDFTSFKKLSREINLPDFQMNAQSGKVGRKSPVDKSVGNRSFYLSHHSEIMASKSISKTHRRHDRMLKPEHLDFMNTNTKIPLASSRNYTNVMPDDQTIPSTNKLNS